MKILILMIVQVLLVCIAVGCIKLVISMKGGGCILGLNLGGLCIIDSILMTIFASIAVTAGGIAISLFKSYAD